MIATVRRRVVTMAPNWLGDAVMSLAAVDRVALHPDWELTVVACPYMARVFWGVEGVAEIQADASGGRVARVHARVRGLKAYGADAVVLLPPSFSSALPAWLARVRTGSASRPMGAARFFPKRSPRPAHRAPRNELRAPGRRARWVSATATRCANRNRALASA